MPWAWPSGSRLGTIQRLAFVCACSSARAIAMPAHSVPWMQPKTRIRVRTMIANLPKPRARTLRTLGPTLAEVGLVLGGAALSAWFVHIFLAATGFNPLSEVATGFGPLWAAVMLLLAVAAQLVQRLNGPANAMRARATV